MNDRLEEQLRSSLDRQAEARPATAPDLGDVFARARSIRRRRTAVVAGVAAAAVLAVVVPTAVIVGGRDGADRGIAPATSVPAPSTDAGPTAAPSVPDSADGSPTSSATAAAGSAGIGGIAIGSPTDWTYLDPQQRLHGASAAIPAPLLTHDGALLIGFSPYHGGWIVTYDDNWIIQADNTGHVVHEGRGGTVVVSSDRMQTAFQIGSVVYSGIASGMGEGEATWHLAQGEGLVGYAGQGPVVSSGDLGYAILTAGGHREPVSSGIAITTASSQGDLVGGVAGAPASGSYSGVVADASTGRVLWHNKWRPMTFSPDGRYVAAVPVIDNGDPGAYAILDARTGAVLAQTPASIADKVFLGWQAVWSGDERILFEGFEADGEQRAALLTLTLDGTFEQASEAMKPVTTDQGESSFVLMTQ